VPADVLVPLTLVVGDEELLVARAVTGVVRAARQAHPDPSSATSRPTS